MTRKLLKTFLALTVSGAALAASGCQKGAAPAQAAPATATPAAAAPAPAAVPAAGPRKLAIQVTSEGYTPSPITLRKGEPVELTLTRTSDETCATEMVLEEYGIHQKLPLNQPVTVRFTPTREGELRYGCAMDKMVAGIFKVE